MNRDDQIQEIKMLLNLVANSATALDEAHRQIADVMGYPRFGAMSRSAKPGIAVVG